MLSLNHASFLQMRNRLVAARHRNIWSLLVLEWIVHKLIGKEKRERHRNINDPWKRNFKGFFSPHTFNDFFVYWFTTLAKASRHT